MDILCSEVKRGERFPLASSELLWSTATWFPSISTAKRSGPSSQRAPILRFKGSDLIEFISAGTGVQIKRHYIYLLYVYYHNYIVISRDPCSRSALEWHRRFFESQVNHKVSWLISFWTVRKTSLQISHTAGNEDTVKSVSHHLFSYLDSDDQPNQHVCT